MIEVILKKGNHTEWVEEAQEDGSTKRVAKIFNRGDQVAVARGTYEAFKDRMDIVEPAAPPAPLVNRLTSLAQELASLTAEERIALLAETGLAEPLSAPIPSGGDKDPELGETKLPPEWQVNASAEKVEPKAPAEKVAAKRPARKIGAKK